MITNISPSAYDYDEKIAVLDYASIAKRSKIASTPGGLLTTTPTTGRLRRSIGRSGTRGVSTQRRSLSTVATCDGQSQAATSTPTPFLTMEDFLKQMSLTRTILWLIYIVARAAMCLDL